MRNRKGDRQTDTQWHTSLILAFGKQRQGDGEFVASLGYGVRACWKGGAEESYIKN